MNTVVIPAINSFPMSALFSYWTVPHMYHKMNVHSTHLYHANGQVCNICPALFFT